jgi:hypothetical protein
MNENTTRIQPTRPRRARIGLLVAAAITALAAATFVGLGTLAFWGDSQKDEHGYLSTDSQRFGADTRALASENLDLDLDGAEGLVDSTGLGDIRLEVESRTEQPVFVGIARTDDVSEYLGGVAHTTLTDLDYDPFEPSYAPQHGERRPAPPAEQQIWAASSQGTDAQKLHWEIEDGDWSVVVMNADGSPGVRADISAGAKLPFLDELAWSSFGGGALLLLAAAGLVMLSVRPPRNRPGAPPATSPVPAAG